MKKTNYNGVNHHCFGWMRIRILQSNSNQIIITSIKCNKMTFYCTTPTTPLFSLLNQSCSTNKLIILFIQKRNRTPLRKQMRKQTFAILKFQNIIEHPNSPAHGQVKFLDLVKFHNSNSVLLLRKCAATTSIYILMDSIRI